MDDYIRAYNAAMREWNKEFHGHAVAPKPECMSLDTNCIGTDLMSVTFFVEVLCKQSGVSCPGHSSPLGQNLAAG